jgi:hypothetical protein
VGRRHRRAAPKARHQSSDVIQLARQVRRRVGIRAEADEGDRGRERERNAQYLAEKEIEGYIADPMFRKRDPRFKGADHHKPTRPCEPHAKPRKDRLFQPKDFQLAKDRSHCICPAGKRLYKSGRALNLRGLEAIKFKGARSACGACVLRKKCLRHPQRTLVRQVAFFIGRAKTAKETYCARMKRRRESGRAMEDVLLSAQHRQDPASRSVE